MKYITTENIWAINIITLFTIFFSFLNEKKELYKYTGRNKIQRNKIFIFFRV